MILRHRSVIALPVNVLQELLGAPTRINYLGPQANNGEWRSILGAPKSQRKEA
jgi:hypothetical protein